MANVRTTFFSEVEERLTAFMLKVQKEIRDKLEAQGQSNTGALKKSIDFDIKKSKTFVEALLYMNDYGQSIDTGVPAENIPYSGNGGGGTSKYIQGLFTYFRLKGLASEEALNAAFATANKAKQEGHPTKASFVYSTNGRRTGFFTDTLNELDNQIDSFFDDLGEGVVIKVINQIINDFEKVTILV